MSRLVFRIVSLLLLSLSAATYSATRVSTPHLSAEFVSSRKSVSPGEEFYAGVLFKIIPEWHIYWKNPGDSGEAPRFKWKLGADATASEIFWPAPKRIPLSVLANYGYEHEILLPVKMRAPSTTAGRMTVELEAEWLVCKEECIPEKGRFATEIEVGESRAEADHAQLFENTLSSVPRSIEVTGAFYTGSPSEGVQVHLPLAPFNLSLEEARFEIFPTNDGVFEAGQAFVENHAADALEFRLTTSAQTLSLPERMGFVLTATPLVDGGVPVSFEFTLAKGVAASRESIGFWWALVGAFIGGLLLNLMPCVLPVLSLKAFSVLSSYKDKSSSLKREGLAYAAGILVSFWVLAGLLLLLRAGGEALGWGFQLQNPVFVLAMFWLFVVLSLNFFGVFELGEALQAWSGRVSSKGESSGAAASFMSGVLATLIATPCTAPFMGSAVGLALALPALQSLLIFTSLAVGMALPVLVIYLRPSLLSALPRPGAWMESFKQFMGFPMLATALWLLWVYGLQSGLDSVVRALFAALALALLLWTSGRFASSKKKLVFVAVLVAAFVSLAWPLVALPEKSTSQSSAKGDYSGLEYEAYSRERLEKALLDEKRPVYVDFTAAWCLTCQVNKRVVFPDPDIQELFRKKRILILKGDWTDKNPSLLAELERFGRSGVPLNLYYEPSKAESPHVFDSLLRPAVVLDAIRQASP
jgi:thiol:disulfide interchange protein DsbD